MSHRIAQDIAIAAAIGALSIPDPGASGNITPDREGICEMTSLAVETRTLNNPAGAGLRLCLRLAVDGGSVTVTAANGFNVSTDTGALFEDVGDQLDMISVSAAAGGFRWEILVNSGAVSLS